MRYSEPWSVYQSTMAFKFKLGRRQSSFHLLLLWLNYRDKNLAPYLCVQYECGISNLAVSKRAINTQYFNNEVTYMFDEIKTSFTNLSWYFFYSLCLFPFFLFLRTSISIIASESKNLRQVLHKAVKKISHIRIVTQFQAPEDDSVMMSHHWLTV